MTEDMIQMKEMIYSAAPSVAAVHDLSCVGRCALTVVIPALAARGEIYPLSAKAETEIVVLDLREDWTLPAEEDYTVEYYQKLGYTVVESADGVCAVLKKNG